MSRNPSQTRQRCLSPLARALCVVVPYSLQVPSRSMQPRQPPALGRSKPRPLLALDRFHRSLSRTVNHQFYLALGQRIPPMHGQHQLRRRRRRRSMARLHPAPGQRNPPMQGP